VDELEKAAGLRTLSKLLPRRNQGRQAEALVPVL